jgi:hypothetical protein
MRLLRLLLLATRTTALVLHPTPTPTLTLIPRDSSTTPAPTAAPTDIYFTTTKLDIIPGVTNDHVTVHGNTITLALPTCIQTITPDKNGYVPPGTCGALYEYYPSFAAAIVFSIIFGALTIGHIFLAARFKTVSLSVQLQFSICES